MSSDVPRPTGPSADSLVWARKRDGVVVAFDQDKLAGSVFKAIDEAGCSDAAFLAQELTQAILHFLAEQVEGRAPTTDDIAETVIKVLREMGQADVARTYQAYRSQRDLRRERLRIDAIEDSVDRSSSAAPRWEKAALIAWLEREADLDGSLAREVAAGVEKTLLAAEFERVSEGLLAELVDLELERRGMGRGVARRRRLGLPLARLESILSQSTDPDRGLWTIGRAIAREYAAREVFSPDVAGLFDEGLIVPLGDTSPLHWAGLAIDAAEVARRVENLGAFLTEFELTLEDAARSSDGVLALTGLDSVLGLLAPPKTSAADLADWCAELFRELVGRRRSTLIVNLDGRVSERVAAGLSEGPLFRMQTSELQDRLAGAFALRLTEIVLADEELTAHVVVDFHPDLRLDDEELALELKTWGRWAARSDRVRVAFDRGGLAWGEGMTAPSGRPVAVYQYLGLNLPALADRLGEGIDDETLLERLGLLCESVVRAGAQKRDFLRRFQADPYDGRDADAAIAVAPIGLDCLSHRLLGHSIATDAAALALAGQVLSRMNLRLRRAGRPHQLACRIDNPPPGFGVKATLDAGTVAGLTAAVGTAGPRQQLAAAGSLHAAVSAGAALCQLAAGTELSVEEWISLVLFAGRKTQVCRFGLARSPATQGRLAADWGD